MRVLIKGAGVIGLTIAQELSSRGICVELAERADRVCAGASYLAGGMIAPFCERESGTESIIELGQGAAQWWNSILPDHVQRNGTLVIAPPRDQSELRRFASRTRGFDWLEQDEVSALEPALASRFRKALFFAQEAHLNPRLALAALYEKLCQAGVTFHFNSPDHDEHGFDRIINCIGPKAIGTLPQLRGVRGEMLYLQTDEIELNRPVRLLHPRHPLYIVPRDEGLFMLGATMIESNDDGPISARSMMELLNAAYALHPAFGEARLVEIGVGVRPSFHDNLPSIQRVGRHFHVNGAHRHGFLFAPEIARRVANLLGAQAPERPVEKHERRGE